MDNICSQSNGAENSRQNSDNYSPTEAPKLSCTIRVLIVDDQSTIQQILKSYLELEPDLEVVGTAADGQAAIEQVKALKPDVVLMDIEMPVIDGLTATRIISERFIPTKVLILSVHDSDEYLNRALQVGAKGYLLKTTHGEELINAIRTAYKGYFQLGPGLLEKYLNKILQPKSNSDGILQLKKMIETQFEIIEKFKNEYNSRQLEIEKKTNQKYDYLTQYEITKSKIMKSEYNNVKIRLLKLEKNLYIIPIILFIFVLIIAPIIVLT